MNKANVMRPHLGVTLVMACVITLCTTEISFCADFSKTIRDEATKMSNALLGNDHETYVAYIFPAVVEMMGGKDKMTQVLQEGNLRMKMQGGSFESVEVGLPGPVSEVHGKLYALVPQIIKMRVSQGTLVTEGHLMAISEDQGHRWYFTDTAPLVDDQKLAMIFPELVGKIKIPPRKPPTLRPDR